MSYLKATHESLTRSKRAGQKNVLFVRLDVVFVVLVVGEEERERVKSVVPKSSFSSFPVRINYLESRRLTNERHTQNTENLRLIDDFRLTLFFM